MHDTVIMADTSEGLQRLIDSISTSGDKMALRIDISKTKHANRSTNNPNNYLYTYLNHSQSTKCCAFHEPIISLPKRFYIE